MEHYFIQDPKSESKENKIEIKIFDKKLEFYTNDLSSPATLEVGSTSCSYTGSTQIPVSSYSDGKRKGNWIS